MRSRWPPYSRWERAVVAFLGSGLLFAGVVQFYALFFGSLYGYWRTRAEILVPAQLELVERRVGGGGRGRTSETKVRYSYSFQEHIYNGDRVSLFNRSDTFYSVLAGSLKEKKPIAVYIDPKTPSFSVIDREFSWFWLPIPLVMATGFTGMGTFFAAAQSELRSDQMNGLTKQCSGLAIKSVLMESPRSRAADCDRSPREACNDLDV